MMIVTANQKGGVGKSTLAVHWAVWLFDQGHSVALLDADKQGSSSQWIAEVEPKITVETADSPEACLFIYQEMRPVYDFVIADGPGGLDDISRSLLIMADLAIVPISPSILDLRSVTQATSLLRFAQGINGGKPEGRLVLNRMRTRDTISRELRTAAPDLGLQVTEHSVRDLQAYRDAAQQGNVVGRMGRKTKHAAAEMDALFQELLAVARGTNIDARRSAANHG
jgi:chromosome partitioning protein